MASPVGELLLGADDFGLCRLGFQRDWSPAGSPNGADSGSGAVDDPARDTAGHGAAVDPVLRAAEDQLMAYFAGELTEFDVPLSLHGSDFELAVWTRLRAIPYGETRSYGQIARLVNEPSLAGRADIPNDPTGARAVGVANNRNPVALIVPCHRVVGANKTLVGYGGGLPRKRHLLELEARVLLERGFLLS